MNSLNNISQINQSNIQNQSIDSINMRNEVIELKTNFVGNDSKMRRRSVAGRTTNDENDMNSNFNDSGMFRGIPQSNQNKLSNQMYSDINSLPKNSVNNNSLYSSINLNNNNNFYQDDNLLASRNFENPSETVYISKAYDMRSGSNIQNHKENSIVWDEEDSVINKNPTFKMEESYKPSSIIKKQSMKKQLSIKPDKMANSYTSLNASSKVKDDPKNFADVKKSVVPVDLDTSNDDGINDKEKMKARRQSKYSQLQADTNDHETEMKLKGFLKDNNNMGEIKKDQRLSILLYKENRKTKKILKFNRSKSVIPGNTKNENEGNKNFDYDKMGLSHMVRANFEKNKIKNLENPNSQEVFNDNKFVRDKTQITQYMNKLKEKIYMENYNDKNKLSLNVFEDFEKQTSWQSYTTLLITDIDNMNDKKEYLLTKTKSKEGTGINKILSKTGTNTKK